MEFSVAGEDEKTGRKQDDLRADGDEVGKSRCVACGRCANRHRSGRRRHRSSETVVGGLFDVAFRHGSRISNSWRFEGMLGREPSK